jgi:predicted dehydrogenase
MKLALLGTDDRIDLVAAAAVAAGHELVAASDLPAGGRWGPIVPWEGLLDATLCDAVLVGSGDWTGARADATRALVQAGRPLLVSHPAELSMLWAWELEMIRQDAGGVLVPLLPDRLHPFVARLREMLEAAVAGAGPHGPVESLVLERRLAERRRDRVLTWLARDVDLVRVIVGEPARIAALGVAPDAEPTAWNSLTVGLTGPTSVPVRWQVAGGGPEQLELSLHCERGRVTVVIPDEWSEPWRWTEPGRAAEEHPFDRAAAVLPFLAGQPRPAGEGVAPARWADGARAIEVAEAVPRSLAKGRAVDLHQEEFSELGTFRGTMASAGCGLILLALGVLVFATLVGGIAHEFGWDLGGRLAGAWPAVVLVALGGFLLLQLLPLLVTAARRPE